MPSRNFMFGFDSTFGSLGAMSILGLIAVVGILLIYKSKDPKTGERNMPMFIIGAIMVVLTSLSFLPVFGLGYLFEEMFQN